MIYEIIELKEQKYVGIKTVIRYDAHDEINFGGLHENVMKAKISNINLEEAIMAIDTDFTDESFSYTPLVAVDSYEGNKDFVHFDRSEGTYYAFEVSAKECGPEWFGRLFEFIEREGLILEETGYDLEYYDYTYTTRPEDKGCDDAEKMLKILLKKKKVKPVRSQVRQNELPPQYPMSLTKLLFLNLLA